MTVATAARATGAMPQSKGGSVRLAQPAATVLTLLDDSMALLGRIMLAATLSSGALLVPGRPALFGGPAQGPQRGALLPAGCGGTLTAYTGTWRGLYATGEIKLSQRTQGGGGIVDEDIGHKALTFTFTVGEDGRISQGSGVALYHFDVQAHAVAFPNQISAQAHLVGGIQKRT